MKLDSIELLLKLYMANMRNLKSPISFGIEKKMLKNSTQNMPYIFMARFGPDSLVWNAQSAMQLNQYSQYAHPIPIQNENRAHPIFLIFDSCIYGIAHKNGIPVRLIHYITLRYVALLLPIVLTNLVSNFNMFFVCAFVQVWKKEQIKRGSDIYKVFQMQFSFSYTHVDAVRIHNWSLVIWSFSFIKIVHILWPFE